MSYSGRSPLHLPVPARHHGLDWLRIGAFLLLMFYHACMVFVTGGWLVKLSEVEWLSFPMMFVSPWRLAILFIIAGYASRALLARLKGIGPFARERTKRLLLPLLFGMALVVPVQSWVRLSFGHGYQEGFGHFLAYDAFRFGPVDGVTLPGWEHLWFVAYLWGFTIALLAMLWIASPVLKARAALWFGMLAKGQRLLWLPLLYFLPVRAAITFTFGESHALFNDWLSDLIYMPCFLFGFGLAGTRSLWPAIARCWKPALALALASYAVLVAIELAYPGRNVAPHLLMAADRAALAAMMWSMAIVMLRLADTLLNRDHKWRQTLSEAIFPCYILHQSVIVLVAWWLLPVGLPLPLAFAVILGATALACWAFYRIGGAIGPLRPLIGLNPRPAGLGQRAKAILRASAG
jgi:glucans biosynthesis protein C